MLDRLKQGRGDNIGGNLPGGTTGASQGVVVEGQVPLLGECQGPKDTNPRFHAPQGKSQVRLDPMQGTADQTLVHKGENTKPVLMGVDGVESLFGLLKNIGVSVFGFEMGTVLGSFWQGREDPLEFGVGDGHVVLGATALGNLGATDALMIDSTNRLPVEANLAQS
jgi:hypothetical protein